MGCEGDLFSGYHAHVMDQLLHGLFGAIEFFDGDKLVGAMGDFDCARAVEHAIYTDA